MPLRYIRTITAIEWSLVLYSLAGAVYSLVFWHSGDATVAGSVFSSILKSDVSGLIWSVLIVIGSLLVIFGLIKKKPVLRKDGWFILAICRLLQVLGILFIDGFTPIAWVYPATIMTVMVILYYHNSVINH